MRQENIMWPGPCRQQAPQLSWRLSSRRPILHVHQAQVLGRHQVPVGDPEQCVPVAQVPPYLQAQVP